MGNSLQEQLLKTGLVDKSKLNQAKKQKSKQNRKPRAAKVAPVTLEEQARQKERAEKAVRDHELNQQREEVRRQREVAAQVRQLVRNNRHPRPQCDDDIPFNFQNKDKVKRIFVLPETHTLISTGKLVIVNDNGVFDLVPPAIAEKIRQRNPSLVIDLPKEDVPAAEDPYADFKVPDALMW